MEERNFLGWSWDITDLISCKNAARALFCSGVSEEELAELDFGQLDLDSVIAECQ